MRSLLSMCNRGYAMTVKQWMKKIKTWLVVVCLLIGFIGTALILPRHRIPRGRVVYVKEVWSSNEGVYVMDPDGNNVERLTPLSCVSWPVVSPVWSPDGGLIAFGCHGGEGYNLCVMSREGMKYTLTPPGCFRSASLIDPGKVPAEFCREYRVHSVSWAPDGQRLAFTCPYDGESGELVCIISLDGEVSCWPVSVTGGVGSSIHSDAKVAWSPVTDRLALSFRWREDNTSKIYLTDPDGQNSAFLTDGWNPRWSPDGKQLVFFRDGKMFAIDKDGHDLQCLYDSPDNPFLVQDLDETPLLFFDSTATWSPSGRFIAFTASLNTSGGLNGIYILNLRTKEIARITELYDGFFREPDWSP